VSPFFVKRVLDLGAVGVVIPLVSTLEEAQLAAKSMRYPPDGIRGVAAATRATRFGSEFKDYFARANRDVLTVVQVETRPAVDNVDAIAAVDGVDILFIGPRDLSTNLGVPGNWESPEFREALVKVEQAARNAGKIPGILSTRPEQAHELIKKGYRFVCVATTSGLLASSALERRRLFRSDNGELIHG